MTERVDSVGDLEEGESSSVGSSVKTLSEDSEEEETEDPQVKEVGSKFCWKLSAHMVYRSLTL